MLNLLEEYAIELWQIQEHKLHDSKSSYFHSHSSTGNLLQLKGRGVVC